MSIAPYDIHDMAQSAVSNQENCTMITKDQLNGIDPDEVLDWEVSKVEAALKAIHITIGKIGPRAKKHMNSAMQLSR